MRRAATAILFGVALLSRGVLSAGAVAGDDPPAKPPDPRKLEVKIEGKELSINGKKITLPCARRVLVAVLGKPSRTLKKARMVLVWDELGVIAAEPRAGGPISGVTVALEKLKGYDFWPKQLFRGNLTIDGASVTAETTIEAINRIKTGKTLKNLVKMLPFSWEIDYEDVGVYVNKAKDGELHAGGTLAEVQIEVK